MALPKKPLSPEEIKRRREEQLAAEQQKQEGSSNMPESTENGFEVPSLLKTASQKAPQEKPVPPTFNPQRRVLKVNEGVDTENLQRKEETREEVYVEKRIRLTSGALTAHDVLTKDYESHYARLTPKVIEVRDWVQNILTENGKNDEVSAARKQRKEKYEEMSTFIDNLLVKYFAEERVVAPKDKSYVIQSVINEVLGLGPLEPLWTDNRISEIMVNGPLDIKVEIEGKIVNAPGCQFRDAEHLLQVCQQILGDIGRSVNVQNPLEDGRLPDGSRINVVHYAVAPDGPYLTIRRFPDTAFSIRELINRGSMTEEMAVEIGNLIHKGCSAVIQGGTGSGKTSALNAFSGAIPEGERTITIEDNLELRLNPRKHVLAMEARQTGAGGKGDISIRHLVKNALRMRPDRLIIGEVRDSSAYDMLQAMSTGHDGSMTTTHANDAEGAINRLVNLIGEIGDFPPERALPLIAGGLDIIVSVDRFEDGSRRLSGIYEVPSRIEMEGSIPTLRPIPLFEFVQDSVDENEKIIGHYERRNNPSDFLVRKHRLDKKRSLTLDELLKLSDI